MKRIVNVLDVFGKGGGKSGRCLKLIMKLDGMGYEQMVIVLNKTDIETHPDIFHAQHVQLHIIEKNRIGWLRSIIRVFSLLNRFHPDVIQVWGKTASSLIINLYAISHRYFKYIGAYIADCLYPSMSCFEKAIHRHTTRRADAFVGNSNAALNSYLIPDSKRHLIYNGFVPRSVPFRSHQDICKELNIDVPYIISMVAVMRKEKDYDTFIRCADRICRQRSDVAFLCIGQGPQLQHYQQQVAQLHQNRIQVLGFRYDVDNYHKASYITVLCDQDSESLSNSILESMAVGTPVIATRCGGNPEIIDDGVNGILIPHRDAAQLEKNILQLLDDSERRNSMSQACLRTVQDKFEINRMIQQYIKLFNA